MIPARTSENWFRYLTDRLTLRSVAERLRLSTILGGRPAGVLFLALALALAFRPGPAYADPNTVVLEPSGVEVAPGGAATVALVADPPPQTLAVWAIDVAFDPDVVTTTSRGCDSLDPLPNSQTVTVCEVTDDDANGQDDTVKVVGAMIFNDTGFGLSDPVVLADITFNVVGEPGRCTDLHLLVRFHADSEGEETNPLLSDGQICIEDGAPASGTAVPHTPGLRTSEPPPDGGPTAPQLNTDGGEPAAGGDQTPSDGSQASPADTGGVVVVGGTETLSPAVSGADDGGDGALFWILLGLGVLVAAGGVAWAVVRTRSRSDDGPSAG